MSELGQVSAVEVGELSVVEDLVVVVPVVAAVESPAFEEPCVVLVDVADGAAEALTTTSGFMYSEYRLPAPQNWDWSAAQVFEHCELLTSEAPDAIELPQ